MTKSFSFLHHRKVPRKQWYRFKATVADNFGKDTGTILDRELEVALEEYITKRENAFQVRE